ncbi:hypothetical protein [Streptomyces sp. NPDC003006]
MTSAAVVEGEDCAGLDRERLGPARYPVDLGAGAREALVQGIEQLDLGLRDAHARG